MRRFITNKQPLIGTEWNERVLVVETYIAAVKSGLRRTGQWQTTVSAVSECILHLMTGLIKRDAHFT